MLLSGCAGSVSGAEAVWTVRPGHQVGPETTTISVVVTRLGCNNGVTGQVQEPGVKVEDDEVRITFTVKPDQREASCPGNDQVPYEVVLPGPLGDRRLIDGQCEPDSEASGTTFCRPDGVRYDPE